MKNIYHILFLLFLSLTIVNCSKIEKQIVGKWQVENVEIIGLEIIAKDLAKSYHVADDDYNNFIKQTVEDLEKNYKSQILKTVIEFTSDNKFDPDCNKSDDMVEWNFDDKQKRIVIKSSNSEIYYYIDKIDSKNMKAKMTSKNNTLEINLVLKKI